MKRWDIRRALGVPAVYAAFQRFARGRGEGVFVNDHLRPRTGDRILDVGCGPGNMLALLPEVDYLGFDMDPRSIDAAKKRHGDRGRFFCDMVSTETVKDTDRFDIVMAAAVLHHLTDGEARDLFALAVKVLNPEGRLVSWDPCWIDGQSLFSRFLMSRDRGQYVRKADEYRDLAADFFKTVQVTVYKDLIRLPLPSVIMECFPRSPG
jgi:SAM-dependent methyltransferase